MRETVLILVNHEIVIYNFRKELVERLLSEGYRVVISSPSGEKINELIEMGCEHDEVEINRHGMNPMQEIKLLNYYSKLLKKIKPDIVFSYTIKPNIYGGLAAKRNHIPYVANITGLGTAVENRGPLQKISVELYKKAFTNIQTIFFQNKENRQFFINHNIATNKHKLLPGSGVNLDYFNILSYPSTEKTIDFVFVSRIMKEKGIEQYLQAAEYIRNKYPNTRFHVCGFCEEEYQEILMNYQKRGIITYHGMVKDIRQILKITHCTIHPTYYPEGLSNVLLESAASGRPIISTNRSGCREVINNGENGYLVKEKDSRDLIDKIETFLQLTPYEMAKMGRAGRKKVEKEFNRQIVVESYMKELSNI